MVWCGAVWCGVVPWCVLSCFALFDHSLLRSFVRWLVCIVDFCKESWNTFNMKTVCSLRSVDPKKIHTVESNRHFFCEI